MLFLIVGILIAGIDNEIPTSMAAAQDKAIDDKIQDLHEELNNRIRKSEPLLSYIKETIANYSSKRKLAQVVIQGSVGNDLCLPEVLQDGVYRVEIDMLFEQDSSNVTLPFLGAEKYLNPPQITVEAIADKSVSSSQYVKLKVSKFPECLRMVDKTTFLEFDETSGEYYLKNSEYLNNLPPIKEEIHGGILGEKELSSHDFMASFYGRKPFRPFKSEKKRLVIGEETIDYQLLMDKVAAIKVKWPDFSISWETRERLWPPAEVCKEIIQYGIHVIPKSSHKSESTTQWKYTFAIAEQRLARMLTPFQKSCYLIFKQLKRKYFNQVSLSDGAVVMTSGISTHHLKTVLFWTSEGINPSEWQSNPGKCLFLLIKTLIDFLQAKHCPNYFVPEVNLFERLWMDESKYLYVKDDHQLRDLRLQAVLDLILEVQLNLKEYINVELLQVVDEDHDRMESNAQFAKDGIFSGWKFKMTKQLSWPDFSFALDYGDACESRQEEKEKKDEL